MDEKELVQRMKAKDKTAFDALYEKYKNTLLRMAYLVSGQMYDAEDIVQETFVKCFLHIGDLKKNEGFRPWLFQILYRTAYAHGRKRKREIPEEDIAIRADATDGVTCLDRIIQTETDWKVKQAVQSLDFKHRAVVVLYYFNEMPIKEIARVLGCTEGTAKSRLFAARKKLKDKLIMLEEGGIKHEEIKSRARHSGLYSL
ncbi:ECF RNA polymerase sigma factor SigW [Lachnospiraceae bacterium]|nr:RNA polymerase sigma factor [Lachnospiraceae bacterium]GFH91253.1 ECF RNA polymerase sigma factor SigW [Lachnospiraceae bacterium]